MKKIFALSLIISCALAAEAIVDTAYFNLKLGYTVELPPDFDTSKTYPLIVALHGYGDRMSSYVGTAQSFCPQGAIGLYPETPYPVDLEGNLGWAWYMRGSPEFHQATVEQSTRWVLQCIEQVKRDYSVDEEKVFLYGFSQGGMMTYQVGVQYPELFRGLLPAGGWLEIPVDSANALDSAVFGLPIRALHGYYDDVVKFEDGETAVTILAEQGVPAEIMRYPTRHTITMQMIEDARDFIYCQLYEGKVPSLPDLLWPDEELEPVEHAEFLKQVLCSAEPVADIEAGLLELYAEVESDEVRKQIIYLLGARRCVGAEFMLAQIMVDAQQSQALRQAAHSAVIKLGTRTAWQAADRIKKIVVIQDVIEGSQAQVQGLQSGDAIISYNGKKIKVYPDLRKAVASVKPDKEQVKMVVERDGKKVVVKLAPGTIGIRLAEEIR